jgi:hypothetical protein
LSSLTSIAGLGLDQLSGGADDVAAVPGLELRVLVFRDAVAAHEQLDLTGAILQLDEAAAAHHPLREHPAGYADRQRLPLQQLRTVRLVGGR